MVPDEQSTGSPFKNKKSDYLITLIIAPCGESLQT